VPEHGGTVEFSTGRRGALWKILTMRTPIGLNKGEVPQFVQHGLTVSYGLSTRLCLVGSTLYMTLAKNPGFGTQRIQLLKKVGN
jgi:hypothetical protein